MKKTNPDSPNFLAGMIFALSQILAESYSGNGYLEELVLQVLNNAGVTKTEIGKKIKIPIYDSIHIVNILKKLSP